MQLSEFSPETQIGILKLEINRLHKLAYTDELTGLPNGRAIREHAERNPGGYWIMIDLDGFKAYQDKNGGHAEGDTVLRLFGLFLLQNTRQIPPFPDSRPFDVVAARLHGDEFAVYVQGSDPREGAGRIAALINGWSHAGMVTASAGVGSTKENADYRMYMLKNARAKVDR